MIEKLKQIKEQISKIEKECYDRITPLRKELYEVNKFIIKNHEIQFGDKVEVETFNGDKIIAFISNVKLENGYKFTYNFNKVKKDGTMSGTGAGISSYKSVKKNT